MKCTKKNAITLTGRYPKRINWMSTLVGDWGRRQMRADRQ